MTSMKGVVGGTQTSAELEESPDAASLVDARERPPLVISHSLGPQLFEELQADYSYE